MNLKTCFQPDKYERIKEVEEELKKSVEEHNKKLQELDKRSGDWSTDAEDLSYLFR